MSLYPQHMPHLPSSPWFDGTNIWWGVQILAKNGPKRCNYIQFIYICKPLYMFRLVSPPIIRTSCHCIHSICLTCLVLLDLMVLIFGEEYKFLPIIVQKDANTYSLFISVNRSTCFGWYLHPSSGPHITVSKASGLSKTVNATCREHVGSNSNSNSSSPLWTCAPDGHLQSVTIPDAV